MCSRSVTGVVLSRAVKTLVFYQMVRASGSGLAYDDCDESSSQGTVICCCRDVVLLMLSKTLAWYQYCNLVQYRYTVFVQFEKLKIAQQVCENLNKIANCKKIQH